MKAMTLILALVVSNLAFAGHHEDKAKTAPAKTATKVESTTTTPATATTPAATKTTTEVKTKEVATPAKDSKKK